MRLRLENKIISLFILIKTDTLKTWHIANLIYHGCMNTPHKSNGGRVSSICREVNKSKFLKLEEGRVFFNKNGWELKNDEKT